MSGERMKWLRDVHNAYTPEGVSMDMLKRAWHQVPRNKRGKTTKLAFAAQFGLRPDSESEA